MLKDLVKTYQSVSCADTQPLETACYDYMRSLTVYLDKPTPTKAVDTVYMLLWLLKSVNANLTKFPDHLASSAEISQEELLDKVVRSINQAWFTVRGPQVRTSVESHGFHVLSLCRAILTATGQNMDNIWHKTNERVVKACVNQAWYK